MLKKQQTIGRTVSQVEAPFSEDEYTVRRRERWKPSRPFAIDQFV